MNLRTKVDHVQLTLGNTTWVVSLTRAGGLVADRTSPAPAVHVEVDHPRELVDKMVRTGAWEERDPAIAALRVTVIQAYLLMVPRQ